MNTTIVLKKRGMTTTRSSRCMRRARRWNSKALNQAARRNSVPYDVIFYKWNRIGNKSWHWVEKFLPKLLSYAVLVGYNQFSSNFFCLLLVLLALALSFLLIFGNFILFFLSLTALQLFCILLLFDNTLNFLLNLLLCLLLSHLIFSLLLLLNSIIQECSSPVNLLNSIIVNVKLRKQNLILFPWIRIFKYFLHFLIFLTWFYHCPEHSVIEIIYVAIYLPPSKIIFKHTFIWIYYHSTIESRYLFQLTIKIFFPVEYISWGECWY